MEAEAGAPEQAALKDDPRDQFAELVEKYWRSAYRFAYRLTGDPEEAADLLQQAAEEALRAFPRFRQGSRFDRWWLRILYNSFVDRKRRQHRRSHFTLNELCDAAVADTRSDPEAAFDQSLDGPVQRDLDALPGENRAAMILVDLEGFTYGEATHVLRCPVGTARSRLHRARLALRERLRDYVDATKRGQL